MWDTIEHEWVDTDKYNSGTIFKLYVEVMWKSERFYYFDSELKINSDKKKTLW